MILVSRKLQTIYKRLFTLFSYLKTKESNDRWVTRRVWGFRHQISKEKDLKMSVGKLQENIAALCKMATKFSQEKDNIFAAVQHSTFSLEWSTCNGCNSLISTPNRAPFEALDCWLPELWKTTLRVSTIRWSRHVSPGKLKPHPLPSGIKRRMWNIWRRWNIDRTEFQMWDIRRRWNVSQTKFFLGWNELCHASQGGCLRVQGRGSHMTLFREDPTVCIR